jgi:O-glycosyl hydrolase
VVGNSDKQSHEFTLAVAGRADSTLKMTLPPESINTFVVPPQKTAAR